MDYVTFSTWRSRNVLEPIIQVRDLQVEFRSYDGRAKVLNGVNLTMESGQRVGLVGESGCEKSVTMRAIMGILRPFVERRLQISGKPWACNQREVPWREHGVESTKLEYLAYRYGLFYDGHRALDDCRIAVHLLAQLLPGSDATALAALLEQARKPSYRVWAIGSPYEAKDLLKARRYRWDVDKRSWWKEVRTDAIEALTRETSGDDAYREAFERQQTLMRAGWQLREPDEMIPRREAAHER